MDERIKNTIYSFAVQLMVLHFRNNHLLLLFWLLLTATATGSLGKRFGLKFLLLNPEYMGRVSFYSFFWVGLAFGGFLMAWNMTIYIVNSYRFPFLASLNRPFTKFCVNNALLPLAFVITYLICVIQFQWYNEIAPFSTILLYCIGFLLGLASMLGIISFYFQVTNKDILNFRKIKRPKKSKKLSKRAAKRMLKIESEKLQKDAWRVETYLTIPLKTKLVRQVGHYPPKLLMKVFEQNHMNALIFQVAGIVLLFALGALVDVPAFRIPAGASMLIGYAILVSLAGALTYWFKAWRITMIIVLFLGIDYLSSIGVSTMENQAYGLNYTTAPAPYTYERMDSLHSPEAYEKDVDTTLQILKTWRNKFQTSRVGRKPKLVILNSSGGGLRQAVWAMQVLQTADSLTSGKLMKHTALMAGASGGMLGMSYFRDLYLEQQLGNEIDIYAQRHIDIIGADLLNPIVFMGVANDLFLPWRNFEKNGYTYPKDRGYIMEQQMIENTNGLIDKRLIDYRNPEREGIIPMLFLTPVITNDARRLIISPQGVTYMAKTGMGNHDNGVTELDAIDFGKFFAEQDAYNLAFTSALRMNSTYPYILPNVHLPSKPELEVMDAGWRDNYGIESVARFVEVFHEWIQKNTSGILIVQIRGSDKVDDISSSSSSILGSFFNPLNIAALSSTLQDYQHDHLLNYTEELLGRHKVELIRFIYRPSKTNERASMTFHLTTREKIDVLDAIYHEDNQQSLRRVVELVK